MENLLTRLFESQDQLMNNFNMGFAAGVAFALLIILFLLLLRIFTIWKFRTRRCSSIAIRRPEGDTEISREAVISVIRSSGSEVKNIVVNKIEIFQRGLKYFLKLRIDFDTSGGSLTPQEDLLRKKIVEGLRNTYGIDSVCRISVKVEKRIGDAIPAAPAPEKVITPEPAPTPIEFRPASEVEPEKQDDKAAEDTEKEPEKVDIKEPDPLP